MSFTSTSAKRLHNLLACRERERESTHTCTGSVAQAVATSLQTVVIEVRNKQTNPQLLIELDHKRSKHCKVPAYQLPPALHMEESCKLNELR